MKWPKFTTREIGASAIAAFAFAMLVGVLCGAAGYWNHIDEIGSFGGMIFTAIAVAVAWIGFQNSEANGKKEFRAYVEPVVTVKHELTGDNIFEIFVRNYGRTPATDVHIEGNAEVRTDSVVIEPMTIFDDKAKLHPSQDRTMIWWYRIADRTEVERRLSRGELVYIEFRYKVT